MSTSPRVRSGGDGRKTFCLGTKELRQRNSAVPLLDPPALRHMKGRRGKLEMNRGTRGASGWTLGGGLGYKPFSSSTFCVTWDTVSTPCMRGAYVEAIEGI